MANVFGGAVQVQTRENRSARDAAPIDFKALNPKAMTDLCALAGTTGTDVKLIHGDRWEQTTGNITTNITGDNKYTLIGSSTSLIIGSLTETVNVNHDWKVLTNLKSYVKGTTTEKNVGKHISSNTGPVTETFVGPVDRHYEATLTETHPENWLQTIKELFHWEPFGMKIGLTDLSVVSALKMDVITAGVCVREIGLGVGADEGEFKLEKFKVVDSEQKLHESIVDTFALQMHLGAMDAGTPFKPNALPRPTPITPLD